MPCFVSTRRNSTRLVSSHISDQRQQKSTTTTVFQSNEYRVVINALYIQLHYCIAANNLRFNITLLQPRGKQTTEKQTKNAVNEKLVNQAAG